MKRAVLGIGICVIVITGVVGVVWNRVVSGDAPPPDGTLTHSVTAIQTALPVREDFQLLQWWMGTVESKRTVRAIAMEEARVLSVEVPDQTEVDEGTVLFTLGGPRLGSRLEAAKQQLSSLRRHLALAEHQVERKETLAKQMIVGQKERFAAEVEVTNLRPQLEAAQVAVQRLQDATRVVAPLHGVFTKRLVSVGQDVQKGEALAEVVDRKHVRIVATLFPRACVPLKGHDVTINILPGETTPGVVARVLPQRTVAGATVIWIEGDQLDDRLLPGQRVAGEIEVATHKASLAVPAGALVFDQQEHAYVFVRRRAGYEKRRVRLGLSAGTYVEIASGIQAEDQVVVQGAYELYYQDFKHVYKVAD